MLIFPNVEMDLFQELQSEIPARTDAARNGRVRQTMQVPRNKFDMEAYGGRKSQKKEKAFAEGPSM